MSLGRTLLKRIRTRKSGAAASDVAARPATSAVECLEERVLFALATALGGKSGYSGTLSTNPTIRQQQLICDPAEPKQGSTSVRYDASMVSLIGLTGGPGYNNKSLRASVQVQKKGKLKFQDLKQFLKKPAGEETGYVQVTYKLSGGAGQIAPPSGFTVMDEGGVSGVDTHALMFTLCPGVDTSAKVDYQVFAAQPKQFGNNKGDFLVTNDGTNTRITPDQLTPAVISTVPAPDIDSTGGPYTINEGDSLTLSASAAGNGSLSYAWDLDGDGVADATGPSPTLTADQLVGLGLGDGPATANVHLEVTDGDQTTSADTTLTIQNVAPTANAISTEAFLGTTMKLQVGATDPSGDDQAAGFTYLVDWDDFTPVDTIAASADNGTGLVLSHDYGAVGVRNVTIRAIDKDGGISDPVHATATVSGAQPRIDPADSNVLALNVVGTSGNDTISFTPRPNTSLEVFINGTSYGVFNNFSRVLAYGLQGNDKITLNDAPGVLFGNGGNDTLITGDHNCAQLGGDGADTLIAGVGRNILIGGAGADTIKGGTNDDLLIAGATNFDEGRDNDAFAVTALANEWASSATYADRIAHLIGATPGGLNGLITLRAGDNVKDDGVVDSLTGNAGNDWYFLKTSGSAIDLADNVTGETVTGL